MRPQKFIASMAMIIAVHAPSALGATSTEIDQLRSEVAAMRSDYEARISALETRLAAAEAAATNATPVEPAPFVQPSLAQPAAAATGNEFNPAASLIMTGTYGQLSQNPETYQIGGFIPSNGDVGPPGRSFRLGESELTLSANIDPYFSGYFVGAFDGDNGTSVEEAYITHVGLIPGGTIRFGRMLSGFGYINEIHTHAWDFVDAPLALQAFFGGQLKDDGLQARWVAPTELLVEVGMELGLGEQFPGTDRQQNDANLVMLFGHVGGDVGFSNSYRFGATLYRSKAKERRYEDLDATGATVTNAFTGDTDMWGLDFIWKWAPDGNAVARSLKLQAEYYHRNENGSLAFDLNGPQGNSGNYNSDQDGWYAQAVYQFMPRWRVGARYDYLDSGSTDIGLVRSGTFPAADFPILADHDPRRTTTMIDFSPSEFSRLRLQYAWDQARFRNTDDQLMLQYIMSLGAHGAHKF
jgi:hypothetical protein